MIELVRHLALPFVEHPGELSIQPVEGESVLVIEVRAHPDDVARIEGDKGRTLRSIRTVVSAAAGERKTTVELIGPDGVAVGMTGA